MSAPNKGAFHRFGRRARWRVFWVSVAFGVGAGSTWNFRETIFAWLIAPAHGALSPFGGLPVFINPVEMWGVTFGLAIKGGLVVAFPVATVSVFQLVSPLLDQRRRRFVALFLPAIFLCYLGGAAFAYFVILPTGMRYLLNFGTNIAVPLISISAYMKIVTALLFWVGVVFEIPLVMFLLAQLRLVSSARFRKFRKYVPFVAFGLGTFITPGFDAVNATMVALPIIVLFEVGLFLAWLAEGGHRTCARKAVAAVVGIWRRLLNALGRVRAWVGRAYRKALKALRIRRSS